MEEKFCAGCEEPVIDKLPACPLQCRTQQCIPYKEKPIYDYNVMPIIWIMGGPGSGKMTQCKKIISTYSFVYISVGQMLRDEMVKGSPRTRCFKSVMGRGELAPNDLVIALLKEAIERNAAKGVRGFIVKGFPRQRRQGLEFERDIGRASLILYLEASEKTLLSRLRARAKSVDRVDEAPCTLRLRIETFMKHNPGIYELYRYRFVKINAEEPPDKVFGAIVPVIDEVLSRRMKVTINDEPQTANVVKKLKPPPISKPIVWVLGGPGTGKGVQCERIIAKYGFTHLSTGDLLRAEVKTGSQRAANLASVMEKGGLVSNDVVLELLKEAILPNMDKANGFLVDGYPREKGQGIAFEKHIAPVTVILYMEASLETMTKRLLGRAESSGRSDDNEQTIKLRLQTFLDNNQKVLDQYPDKLVRINAEADKDTVFKQVERALDPIVAVCRI